MTSGRRLVCIGGAVVLLATVGAFAQGFTTIQVVHFTDTTIAENATFPSPDPVPYPITATFAQLDPAIATLDEVTLEYNFDFVLVVHIPAMGGGSGGGSIQGNMLVNDAMLSRHPSLHSVYYHPKFPYRLSHC